MSQRVLTSGETKSARVLEVRPDGVLGAHSSLLRLALAILVAACWAPAGGGRQSSDSAPPGSSSPKLQDAAATRRNALPPTVLETLPVPGQVGHAFSIEIGACRKPGECPFQVSLVEGKKILSRMVLTSEHGDWLSATPTAERQQDVGKWGAADGIVSRKVDGWTSGEESTFVGLIARPLSLSPAIGGIVVDLVGGFEHLKRGHFVLAAVDGKLVKAWHFQEGSGWTWSTTDVVRLDKERQGVAFFWGSQNTIDVDDLPDTADMQILGWDADERRLVPQTRKGRGYAAVVGPFGSIPAAKKARDAKDPCMGNFSIRPAKEFRPGSARGFLLVQLTSFPKAAAEAVRRARGCLPRAGGSVVALK